MQYSGIYLVFMGACDIMGTSILSAFVFICSFSFLFYMFFFSFFFWRVVVTENEIKYWNKRLSLILLLVLNEFNQINFYYL